MPSHIIEFVNREYELDQICRPGSKRFIILDGAPGLGKTDLLHKVKERYEALKRPVWRAAYIDLHQDPQFSSQVTAVAWPALAGAIIGALPNPGAVGHIQPGTSEEGIASILVPYVTRLQSNVLLLFDGIEVLLRETSAWLERLIRDLDQGQKKARRELRAVFAGRYVRDWGHSRLFPLPPISLSSFDRVAVTDMIRQVIEAADTDVDQDSVDELAWWILDVSGGHPQGICDILRVISTVGFIYPNLEFTFLRQQFSSNGASGTLLELCIEPIIDKILSEVPQQLHRVLSDISPIRGFNPDLLDLLLQRQAIDQAGGRAGWELIRALTQTHLIKRATAANPMYSDHILRRMLAVQLRLRNPARHQQIQTHARDIFHQWALAQGPLDDQVRRVAILESLYHTLQLEPPTSPEPAVQNKLAGQLDAYVSSIPGQSHKDQIRDALCNDQELVALIEHRAGIAAFQALLGLIDRYL